MNKDQLTINKYNNTIYLTEQYIKKFNNIYYFFDKYTRLSNINSNELFSFKSSVSNNEFYIIGLIKIKNELKYIVTDKMATDESDIISYCYDLPQTMNINNTAMNIFCLIIKTHLNI
jgi:hypothetical protein